MPGELSANSYKCTTKGCKVKVRMWRGVIHRYCRKCRLKMGLVNRVRSKY